MLHEADAAIVARETSLPGLAWLLDDARLLAALRTLPGLDDVTALQTDTLRYKPGVSCVAGWRLRRRDGTTFALYGKALGAARFAEAWARPHWQAAREVDPAAAPRCLPEACLLVLRPIDDRTLKGLRVLLGGRPDAALTGLWRQSLPSERDNPILDMLRYKPERRWVGCARDSLDGADRAVVRAYGADRFGSALAGAAFGMSAGGARLLGASARLGVLVAEWLPGEPVWTCDRPLPPASVLVDLGTALARLHALPVGPLRCESRAAEIDGVRRALDALAQVLPSAAARAHALGDLCARQLAVRVPLVAPVHGDFSLDQIVRHQDSLSLLDWDRAASGDPTGDAGSLWARLELQAIEGSLSRDDVGGVIDAIREGYDRAEAHSRTSASGLSHAAVRLQAAAHLLRLAAEPFRRRSRHWPEHSEALLERAGALLGRPAAQHPASTPAQYTSEPSTGSSLARSAALSPALFPALARALDAESVEARLVDSLRLPAGSTLAAPPELVRHRPGRRALVSYRMREPDGCELRVLGKLRAKGFDHFSYELQGRLWRDGFGAAGVSVPEPLAAWPEDGLWLQRWVPGSSAAECIRPGPQLDASRRIARALAAFHGLRLPCGRAWTVDDELRLLQHRLDEVAALGIASTVRIGRLHGACTELAGALPTATTTGIHRDFYADQVLVDGERIVLLDFDLAADGDPALDAGNFVAHLIEAALRRHGDVRALDPQIEAFADAFLARSPTVKPIALNVHTTLSLVRQIWVSTQIAERRHLTDALVELCEARLILVERESSRHAPGAR